MHEIDKQLAIDIIVGAVEQGISYWARTINYNPDAGTCTVLDFCDEADETARYAVTPETVTKALETLVTGPLEGMGEKVRARLIGELHLKADDSNLDASDYDMLLQIGIFGKVIYG